MKTRDDKTQRPIRGAANSPHFQQEGIASAMPPTQLFSEEEVVDKEEVAQNKENSLADSGGTEIPPYDPNNPNQENILNILQRRHKEATKDVKPKQYQRFEPKNLAPRQFRKVEPFQLSKSAAYQRSLKESDRSNDVQHEIIQKQRTSPRSPLTVDTYIESSNENAPLFLGDSVSYKLIDGSIHNPANRKINWYVENDLLRKNELGSNLKGRINLGYGYMTRTVYASLPGAHKIIAEVDYGSNGDKTTFEFIQHVVSLDEIASKQQESDLSDQFAGINEQLVAMEQLSGTSRLSAVELGTISASLLEKWGQAQTQIIILSSLQKSFNFLAFKENNSLSELFFAKAKAKNAIRDFYLALREEFSILDFPGKDLNPVFTVSQLTQRLTELENGANYLHGFLEVVGSLDQFIVSNFRQKDFGEEADQLEATGEYARKIGNLAREHPDAIKIKAVFYPKAEKSVTIDEVTKQASITGIPLDMFAYKEGNTWTLVELKTKEKPRINKEGADSTTPPKDLFEELNTKLRFPKGILYFEIPGEESFHIETTEPWSLSDWLTVIGGVVLVAGITAATFGTGTAATVLIVGGVVASIAGNVAHKLEKEEHDMLTTKDIAIGGVELAADLLALVSLGGSKLLAAPLLARRFTQLAQYSGRLAAISKTAAVSSDILTVLTSTVYAYDEIKRLADSDLPEDQKQTAIIRLGTHLLTIGAIGYVGIRNLNGKRPNISSNIDLDDWARKNGYAMDDLNKLSKSVKDGVSKNSKGFSDMLSDQKFITARDNAWLRYQAKNGANGRFKTKIAYEEMYNTFGWSRKKGTISEGLFQDLMGGFNNPKSYTVNVKGKALKRFSDNVRGNTVREIKSGNVTLSSFVEKQINKDIALMNQQYFDAEWHFFGTVSSDVTSKLDKAGIAYFVYN